MRTFHCLGFLDITCRTMIVVWVQGMSCLLYNWRFDFGQVLLQVVYKCVKMQSVLLKLLRLEFYFGHAWGCCFGCGNFVFVDAFNQGYLFYCQGAVVLGLWVLQGRFLLGLLLTVNIFQICCILLFGFCSEFCILQGIQDLLFGFGFTFEVLSVVDGLFVQSLFPVGS